MACAGYLVLESATPVFAELSAGVLLCWSPRACGRHKGEQEEETPAGDATAEELERALPALEPRLMDRREASPTHAQRQKMAGHIGIERVLQLSGLAVDVLEREDELDVPSLPGSFQVVTYKVTREPDGSTSSAQRDSVILTARDAASRQLWIKHIKFWNRFGWREAEAIAAERSDLAALEAMALRFQQTAGERREQSRASLSGRASASSGSSSRRQHRRRFYRASRRSSLVLPPPP